MAISNGLEQSEQQVPEYLQIQEANNICLAAYKEIMTMAMKEKTWVVGIPAVCGIDDIQQMLRAPPSPEMEIEYSIESAVVPVNMERIVSIMTNVHEWAYNFSNIVHYRTTEVPNGILKNLSDGRDINPNIRDISVINAELYLPTPFVSTRKFSFVRFLWEIIKGIWAIVDVSTDYFPSIDSTLKATCKRRPSGMIIRNCDFGSEVIWMENMEVQKRNVQYLYSGVMNSDLAFNAKRWISTMSSQVKRMDASNCITYKMPMTNHSRLELLMMLTKGLKNVYLSCVTEPRDETKWDLLSEKGVKILKDTDKRVKNSYMAVASFRIEATPLSAFNFLVKRNRELQWPNLQELEEPQEVIKFANNRNCITLHAKSVMQIEATEDLEYFLQDSCEDESCSFIISSPLTQQEIKDAWFAKFCCSFKVLGFSIIPDGSGGLHSDASFVTIALHRELDDGLEPVKAIEVMSKIVSDIIGEINEAVTEGAEAMQH